MSSARRRRVRCGDRRLRRRAGLRAGRCAAPATSASSSSARAARVQIVDTSEARASLAAIDGLGDLSHASVVFSRDGRYAYVFGRDGALTKVDLPSREGRARACVQAGNSIGGAISQDGRARRGAELRAGRRQGVRRRRRSSCWPTSRRDATAPTGKRVEGRRPRGCCPAGASSFSLFDADEIWIADLPIRAQPQRARSSRTSATQPYDALVTPDGRYYIAGLFGEDGLALLDLWTSEAGCARILGGYGRGEEKLPVYKMPHLRGWAVAGRLRLPAGDRPPRGAGGRHRDLAGGRRASRSPASRCS